MFMFRVLCALLVAWAIGWALTLPPAAVLREEIPFFVTVASFAGAFIGFVNLAPRQGWGMIVAIANGIWTGALTLILAAFLYVMVETADTSRIGQIDSDFISKRLQETTAEVVEILLFPPLAAVCIAATAVIGVVTELIHWAMVRLRRMAGIKERNTRRAHRPQMYGH